MLVLTVLAAPLSAYPPEDYAGQVAEDKEEEVGEFDVNQERSMVGNPSTLHLYPTPLPATPTSIGIHDEAMLQMTPTSGRGSTVGRLTRRTTRGTRASRASRASRLTRSAMDQTTDDAIRMKLSTRFSYLVSSPNLDDGHHDETNATPAAAPPSPLCTLDFWVTGFVLVVVEMAGAAVSFSVLPQFVNIMGQTNDQAGQSALIVFLCWGIGRTALGLALDYMDLFTLVTIMLLMHSALCLTVSYTYSSIGLFTFGIAMQQVLWGGLCNAYGPLGVHVFAKAKQFQSAWPKLMALVYFGIVLSIGLFTTLQTHYDQEEGQGYPHALRQLEFIFGVLDVIAVIAIGYLHYKHGATGRWSVFSLCCHKTHENSEIISL